MSNVILISNNEIGFQVSIGNNEGRLRRIVTAESFYTDYGFVIPVTAYDMLILDYLDARHDIKLPLDGLGKSRPPTLKEIFLLRVFGVMPKII